MASDDDEEEKKKDEGDGSSKSSSGKDRGQAKDSGPNNDTQDQGGDQGGPQFSDEAQQGRREEGGGGGKSSSGKDRGDSKDSGPNNEPQDQGGPQFSPEAQQGGQDGGDPYGYESSSNDPGGFYQNPPPGVGNDPYNYASSSDDPSSFYRDPGSQYGSYQGPLQNTGDEQRLQQELQQAYQGYRQQAPPESLAPESDVRQYDYKVYNPIRDMVQRGTQAFGYQPSYDPATGQTTEITQPASPSVAPLRNGPLTTQAGVPGGDLQNGPLTTQAGVPGGPLQNGPLVATPAPAPSTAVPAPAAAAPGVAGATTGTAVSPEAGAAPVAGATAGAVPVPVPTAEGAIPAYKGPTDQQTLAGQSPTSQGAFKDVYGQNADKAWQIEHGEELKNIGLYGAAKPPAGTAPVAAAPAGIPAYRGPDPAVTTMLNTFRVAPPVPAAGPGAPARPGAPVVPTPQTGAAAASSVAPGVAPVTPGSPVLPTTGTPGAPVAGGVVGMAQAADGRPVPPVETTVGGLVNAEPLAVLAILGKQIGSDGKPIPAAMDAVAREIANETPYGERFLTPVAQIAWYRENLVRDAGFRQPPEEAPAEYVASWKGMWKAGQVAPMTMALARNLLESGEKPPWETRAARTVATSNDEINRVIRGQQPATGMSSSPSTTDILQEERGGAARIQPRAAGQAPTYSSSPSTVDILQQERAGGQPIQPSGAVPAPTATPGGVLEPELPRRQGLANARAAGTNPGNSGVGTGFTTPLPPAQGLSDSTDRLSVNEGRLGQVAGAPTTDRPWLDSAREIDRLTADPVAGILGAGINAAATGAVDAATGEINRIGTGTDATRYGTGQPNTDRGVPPPAPADIASVQGTPSSIDRPQTGEEVIPPRVPAKIGDASAQPTPSSYDRPQTGEEAIPPQVPFDPIRTRTGSAAAFTQRILDEIDASMAAVVPPGTGRTAPDAAVGPQVAGRAAPDAEASTGVVSGIVGGRPWVDNGLLSKAEQTQPTVFGIAATVFDAKQQGATDLRAVTPEFSQTLAKAISTGEAWADAALEPVARLAWSREAGLAADQAPQDYVDLWTKIFKTGAAGPLVNELSNDLRSQGVMTPSDYAMQSQWQNFTKRLNQNIPESYSKPGLAAVYAAYACGAASMASVINAIKPGADLKIDDSMRDLRKYGLINEGGLQRLDNLTDLGKVFADYGAESKAENFTPARLQEYFKSGTGGPVIFSGPGWSDNGGATPGAGFAHIYVATGADKDGVNIVDSTGFNLPRLTWDQWQVTSGQKSGAKGAGIYPLLPGGKRIMAMGDSESEPVAAWTSINPDTLDQPNAVGGGGAGGTGRTATNTMNALMRENLPARQQVADPESVGGGVAAKGSDFDFTPEEKEKIAGSAPQSGTVGGPLPEYIGAGPTIPGLQAGKDDPKEQLARMWGEANTAGGAEFADALSGLIIQEGGFAGGGDKPGVGGLYQFTPGGELDNFAIWLKQRNGGVAVSKAEVQRAARDVDLANEFYLPKMKAVWDNVKKENPSAAGRDLVPLLVMTRPPDGSSPHNGGIRDFPKMQEQYATGYDRLKAGKYRRGA